MLLHIKQVLKKMKSLMSLGERKNWKNINNFSNASQHQHQMISYFFLAMKQFECFVRKWKWKIKSLIYLCSEGPLDRQRITKPFNEDFIWLPTSTTWPISIDSKHTCLIDFIVFLILLLLNAKQCVYKKEWGKPK